MKNRREAWWKLGNYSSCYLVLNHFSCSPTIFFLTYDDSDKVPCFVSSPIGLIIILLSRGTPKGECGDEMTKVSTHQNTGGSLHFVIENQ